MRDFFISSLEKLITVIIVLMSIAVVIAALGTMFGGQPGGGFLAGLAVLVFGAFYVLLMGGMMFLFLGIYDNTKRTAEAVERMSQGSN